MKRYLLISLVIAFMIIGLSTTLAARNRSREEAKKKREAAYQAALQAYSRELKPGHTRKEVEDYLRAHNTVFTQMTGVSLHEGLVDLVKIGEDDHPWFCNENFIYIAFDFSEQPPPFIGQNSDVLKRASILPMLGGCL